MVRTRSRRRSPGPGQGAAGARGERRHARRLYAAILGVVGLAVLLAAGLPTASADSGRVSAQYQGYAAAGGQGQDPYANDNPQDVHVDGFGGQPVVNGFLRINLDSLPSGSTINGLRLTLVPNSSQSDNVNAVQASLRACILDQPLASSGYQSNPPPYDCNAVHADGEPQNDGSWVFELGPLAERWSKTGNTGLAVVAFPPPNGTGTSVAVSPTAWSVAFDHTKTAATVDYSPGSAPALAISVGSAPAPAPSQAGAPASGSTAPAHGAAASLGPPAAAAVPAIHPAPVAAAAPPTAAPAAPPAAPSSGATAPAQLPAATTAPAARPRVDNRWWLVTAALGGAAVLMLVVGAGQQVLRGGVVGAGARLSTAFSASRSQLATPVAVLALAAVFSLGYTGGLPSVPGTSSGAGIALGGNAGSGGGAAGGPAPGSTTTGPGAPALQGGASGATLPGSGPGGSGSTSGTGSASGGPALSQPGTTTAGGSGSAAANTNGGMDGPGVTSTTVRLGFIYITNKQAANNAFGVKVADVGNEQSEEQALVDYMNKHGGIAGRQIQPVYVAISNAQAETDPNVGEEACHSLTEDYHVFAVVGGGGPPDDANANACYAQAGTMNFDPQSAGDDLTFLHQASPYIWLSEDPALDRTMRWEIAGLQSRKFFSNSPAFKLGVVVAQDPINERVWQQVTQPALQAAGVTDVQEFEVPHDTLDDTANAMKQAVVRFQASNVTHVIFQGGGASGIGSYALLFMLGAESQHYNPRYGLNSEDGPIALAQNIPPDQFQDSAGEPLLVVGTNPGLDTDDQHFGAWPSRSDEKTCASIEAAAGNSFTSREGALAIIAYCDSMFELQEGAQGLTGQALNAQLWADQAMRLGTNLFNAGPYVRTVAPSHWDGAGGYRLLHAVQNCEGSNVCIAYDNPNVYS